ncbi:HlyD family efflux transporter periplasmic adaptor subunit [Serratia sp. UGAL515B_01]|uniref:HlyD family efflux transporter periplasmic adaptor subunit n=1 Tax=Serratia sp. UGAL515B_01 TaxID=2986763 RepID=UPI0029535E2C|nr:HlyD family efflux transporter periplasmic adaptor subunit [Serratia sp. UGAL515B_01]WON77519.1 HlyD family efflux transporter periplasmic adaptor subunit [Serratia sp. UGAL515B_01]
MNSTPSRDRTEKISSPISFVIWLSFLSLLAFGVWSFYAVLDEVTIGTGKVTPASQEQVIESLDGGILSEMLVKKGEIVKKGQILAKLDPNYFESSVGEAQARVFALQASIERLNAELNNVPLAFSDDVKKDPVLVMQESHLYDSRRLNLKETIDNLTNSKELVERELAMTAPLVRLGAASPVEVIRLQRQISEFRGKIDDARNTYFVNARQDLVKAKAEMEAQTAIMNGRKGQLNRTIFTSPVNGIIKEIHVSTLGGVLKPGEKMIEIIPLDDQLLIETRINPRDIAYIRPGLDANVKITAYDSSIYGDIKGKVDIVSPDTLQDEVKPDQFYYRIYVRTNSIDIKNKAGKSFPIMPGMVASVEIKTGQKSVFDYLVKPLNKVKESLRER